MFGPPFADSSNAATAATCGAAADDPKKRLPDPGIGGKKVVKTPSGPLTIGWFRV